MFPITTNRAGFICLAFPDVCKTPTPGGEVPIPYPNVGQFSQAEQVSEDVFVGGKAVVTEASYIDPTTGDEPGTGGGVVDAGKHMDQATFEPPTSREVYVNGQRVVCMFDSTKQNGENARGTVLGGEPTVLVGGGGA
ncbi:DUF4150 domain-containing protein [Persicimonas caeni]|uniref:DUF4150 domain-containing protein n=1 Tax=Persicimonas caeni TaxID=2292766 RepID=A0A4Y6PVJ6_PERCE|nr:DUF4150 domain-containing protein [Persicimonas caeni]QDG52263.1 DUF4150 domain-containing protein [Persicimonas caeni]QED33485.1 DUF4150 domain-containing protein [Persicimonas caeni]